MLWGACGHVWAAACILGTGKRWKGACAAQLTQVRGRYKCSQRCPPSNLACCCTHMGLSPAHDSLPQSHSHLWVAEWMEGGLELGSGPRMLGQEPPGCSPPIPAGHLLAWRVSPVTSYPCFTEWHNMDEEEEELLLETRGTEQYSGGCSCTKSSAEKLCAGAVVPGRHGWERGGTTSGRAWPHSECCGDRQARYSQLTGAHPQARSNQIWSTCHILLTPNARGLASQARHLSLF